MANHKFQRYLAVIGAVAVAALAYARLVRPWHLRCGSSPKEARRQLPGDDIVPTPAMSTTHAVVIEAPVERVWSWLVQIGQGRGGFYSYEWLENLFAMDIHNTMRIQPELQNPQLGDIIPFWKGAGIPIVQIEPPHLMILGGSFAPEQPPGGGWMFLLASPDPLTTRLIVRTRVARYRPEWLTIILYRLILEPVHFIMERGMLMGLKRWVEKTRR